MRVFAFLFRVAMFVFIALCSVAIMVEASATVSDNAAFTLFAVPLFLSVSWLTAKAEVFSFRPWETTEERRARGYVGYKSFGRLLARIAAMGIVLVPAIVWLFFDSPKSAGWCAATALCQAWLLSFSGLFYLWRYLLRDYLQEIVWSGFGDSSWGEDPSWHGRGLLDEDICDLMNPDTGLRLSQGGWAMSTSHYDWND